MPTLPYGCSKALPENVEMAWGARLIYPDDLLWDRQGCLPSDTYEKQHMKADLLTWLSAGAGDAARREARALAEERELHAMDQHVLTLYEDKDGIVVGSPQGSGGYLYLAAYLFKHVKED
jgi:hypothetical protein